MGYLKIILVSAVIVTVVRGQSFYQDPGFDEDALDDYVGNDVGGPADGDTASYSDVDYDTNDNDVYSRKKREAEYDAEIGSEGSKQRDARRARRGGRGRGRWGGFLRGVRRGWQLYNKFRG